MNKYAWYFVTREGKVLEEVDIALLDKHTNAPIADLSIHIDDLLQLIRSNSLSIYYNTPIDPGLVDVLDEQVADMIGEDDVDFWNREPQLLTESSDKGTPEENWHDGS